MLVEFNTFCDESCRVLVDPARVVSMVERTNRLAYRGEQETLLIELETGSKIEVYDSGRRGVERLKSAFYPSSRSS